MRVEYCNCIHCGQRKVWNATNFAHNQNFGPNAAEFVKICRTCSNARQRRYVAKWKAAREAEERRQ